MSLLNKILTLEDAKEQLGFDDRHLMLIGIPILTIWVSLLLFGNNFLEVWKDGYYTSCVVTSFIYCVAYWFSLRAGIIYLRTRYPFREEVRKRIFLQIFLMLLIYAFVKLVLHEILHNIAFLNMDHTRFEPSELVLNLTSLTLGALVLAIYEGNYFYNLLNKSLIEKEQLQRENIQSQLESLKNQVNPHFLFNSLNTLAYIIPENQEVAVSFVQKLSKVYRYILEIREKKLISLAEELDFIHAYIFLLKERFGENLQVKIDVPEKNYYDKIVPLSMQILFENAIKHNIISSSKPLTIEVFMEGEDTLVVKNNLQKKNQVMNSTKLGLQNIKNRYKFFSEEKVKVINTAESFIVVLPLIKMKNAVEV